MSTQEETGMHKKQIGHPYCFLISLLLTGISFLFLHGKDYPSWSWLLMYAIFFIAAEFWRNVTFQKAQSQSSKNKNSNLVMLWIAAISITTIGLILVLVIGDYL